MSAPSATRRRWWWRRWSTVRNGKVFWMKSRISPHVVRRTPGPITTGAGCHGRGPLLPSTSRGHGALGCGLPPVRLATSNLAGDVLLHPVGHLDQPPPGPLQERHHAIHVAIARQRNFDLALALGPLRLALFHRVGFRQRLVGLSGQEKVRRPQL